METDEERASTKLPPLGDDDDSSATGRDKPGKHPTAELHCLPELDEPPPDGRPSPVSGEDASEAAVQSDAVEKGRLLGEGAVVDSIEKSDPGGGYAGRQVREVEDLDNKEKNGEPVIDNTLAGVSAASEHAGSVDMVDRVNEEKDSNEAVGRLSHSPEEDVNLDVTAGRGDIENAALEHVGYVNMVGKVAEEKDLDAAVVEVPLVSREEVNLDGIEMRDNNESAVSANLVSVDIVGPGAEEKELDAASEEVTHSADDAANVDETETRDEIQSAVPEQDSVYIAGVVAKEKELDAAVVELPSVAEEEAHVDEPANRNCMEVAEDGDESDNDVEIVNANETSIGTGAAGVENVTDTAVETNETDKMEDEISEVGKILQADDTATKMEMTEADTLGVDVQVREEFPRMRMGDAPMAVVGGEEEMAMDEKDNVAGAVEEIKELKDEVEGNSTLEKTAEVEGRSAEKEVTEEGNVAATDTAETEEEGDESAMVKEIRKEEDVEAADEADDMEEEADAADTMEETVDAKEPEPSEESEEQNTSNASGKRKRGKNSKALARGLSKKKMEEDVCFICFDGGELVLCDRRFKHL